MSFRPGLVQPGEAYILFADRNLVAFVKPLYATGLKAGRDVGLISYDDTPLKEIPEGSITVISTDFERMGRTVLHKLQEKIASQSRFIRRKSF